MADPHGIEASFARQTIMGLIGASLHRVGDGEVTIDLPHRADLCQQDGFLHAGVVSTIADSAGGYAALSGMPEGARVLTTEFRLHLLRPAHGASFRARGEVIKTGRTLTVTRLDVWADPDGDAPMHVATGTQTCICLPAAPPPAPPARASGSGATSHNG